MAAANSSCPISEMKEPKATCPAKQVVNERNRIPTNLDASPDTGAVAAKLPRARRVSSIPSSHDGESWVYPSPSQFHTALARKGLDPDAEYVPMMVNMHDELNERAWQEVKKWECLNCDPKAAGGASCPPVYLHSLRGRKDMLSPRARMAMWFYGSPRPFDRHDWVVDRGGKRVRYVIDYYYSEESGGSEKKVDESATFYLDVRPALDSSSAIASRMHMWWKSLFEKKDG